jgi:hypothetical protein
LLRLLRRRDEPLRDLDDPERDPEDREPDEERLLGHDNPEDSDDRDPPLLDRDRGCSP